MDDNNRNLILATILSFLVIVVWYTLIAPAPTEMAEIEPNVSQQTLQGQPVTAGTVASVGGSSPVAVLDPTNPVNTAGRVEILTSSLAGSISLAGGRVDDLSLTQYHVTQDPTSPHVRLLAPSATSDPTSLEKPYYALYGWSPVAGTPAEAVPGPSTIWQVEEGSTLSAGNPVTLVWDNGKGQTFRRMFEVDDEYLFTITQSVTNQSGTSFAAAPYAIVARHGLPETQNYFVLHEGVIGSTDGTLYEEDYDDVADLDVQGPEGRAELINVAADGWLGFTDKYWMTALVPPPGQPFTAVVKYAEAQDIYQTETRLPVQTTASGATTSIQTHLFAGAKVVEILRNYEETLGISRFDDAVDWGIFYFLTKPIFSLLHWLHGVIGNMGWAIIALTFVLKALVFPLARKSYVSMARMRELQPQMEALKEQTGDDKMAYQKQVMALYKSQKVNPAAGCLPMLIQIPIFFSLYKVIFVTIELRHAPWMGWIRDLSAPDPTTIWNLWGLLPFGGLPTQGALSFLALPALAIVLGLTMWVQQKLNPAPTDPAQKMIFALMPWVFMFMLGSFASGLVLYWITNNLITIVQQYTIMSMHGQRPNLFGNIRKSVKPRRVK